MLRVHYHNEETNESGFIDLTFDTVTQAQRYIAQNNQPNTTYLIVK